MGIDEVCPSCGQITQLDEYTGWCADCSAELKLGNSVVHFCVRCNAAFTSVKSEFICPSCKTEDWANAVEHLMGTYSISHTRAKQLVALGEQATCLCCGSIIPRGTKGRHLFCSKPKCKSASRRVKHLRLDKGMSKQEALKTVLEELAEDKKAA